MWRGVVLTHAVCILHLRPRDFNWDTSGCSPFLMWFFKANCCLPLPYFTSDILVQYDILRTLKNTLHFGDKNNISKSSGWCLQQMLKKDSNSSHPVSVTVWWVGFFWVFFLLLYCANVRSFPLLNEIREKYALGLTWQEGNWRQTAWINS